MISIESSENNLFVSRDPVLSKDKGQSTRCNTLKIFTTRLYVFQRNEVLKSLRSFIVVRENCRPFWCLVHRRGCKCTWGRERWTSSDAFPLTFRLRPVGTREDVVSRFLWFSPNRRRSPGRLWVDTGPVSEGEFIPYVHSHCTFPFGPSLGKRKKIF